MELVIRDDKIDGNLVVSTNCDGLLPCFWLTEHRTVDSVLRQHIKSLPPPDKSPAFMPGYDLISSRRNVCEFKAPSLVRHCVIRKMAGWSITPLR